MAHHKLFNEESSAYKVAFCARNADGSVKLFDYDLKCHALNVGMMERPCMMSEDTGAKTSDEGSGVGSGSTTVVVSTNQSQDHGGVLGHNMVSAQGVDGVVSNVFNKEEVVKVDADPTLRKDLCLETYCCFGFGSGGYAWFFKMPDCLGIGCNEKSLCNELACTIKLLQKPTCCECVGACSILDMSTCCSDKGENDDSCCIARTCQFQCTYCCLCQHACRERMGLMRTCLKCWLWLFITDWRCSIPPSSSAPMQCTICGFGYRFYEHGGCGCRIRADTDEANAPTSTNTTVVVVNS